MVAEVSVHCQLAPLLLVLWQGRDMVEGQSRGKLLILWMARKQKVRPFKDMPLDTYILQIGPTS
jgi:hypothetical protein